MKRKIALLFALLLTASATLVACGDKCDSHVDDDRDEVCDVCGKTVSHERTYLSFEGLYNSDYEPELQEKIEFGKAKNASDLENLSLLPSELMNQRLVMFGYPAYDWDGEVAAQPAPDEIKCAILDTETAEIVMTLKQEAEDALVTSVASLMECGDEVFILVTEINRTYVSQGLIEYSTELFTADGKKVTGKNADYIYVDYLYDNLYEIDGKIYEIEDGSATYVADKGFTEIPNVDFSTETHHYNVTSGAVRVYDLEYKLVACYVAPSAYEMHAQILADGNVFLQLFRLLPTDAETYDLYMDGEKINFHTMIFNITDNKAKTIDFDYLVEEIYNVHTTVFDAEFEDVADEKAVTNVAVFYEVVCKEPNYSEPLVADFDNSMKLHGYLGGEIDNQYGISEPIGDERYIATDKGGKRFLLNEKGEVIGELGEAYYDAELKAFHVGGKYYDLDLKQVYDANEIDYQYLFVDGGSDFSIYAKEKGSELTYFIRHGYEMTKLDLPKNVGNIRVGEGYFTYTYFTESENKDGAVEYREYVVVCNRQGDKVYSVETTADTYGGHEVLAMGNMLLIRQVVATRVPGVDGEPDGLTYTVRNYIAK